MKRFLTLALLAGAALPAAARAQEDNDRPQTGMERREAAAAQRAERGPRPDNQQRFERPARPEGQPAFAARPERQQRDFAPQQQAQPQAQPAPTADRGGWQGRRDGGNWQGRGNGDGNGWRGGDRGPRVNGDRLGPSAAQPIPGNDAWNEMLRSDTTGRGGAINRANREREERARDRDRDGRRDGWNDGRRNDWNDGRRWDNNGGRWDGNRNARNWDRSWRNNSRYDWQRYRSSNRYAYRLPRYYAPNGWGYGYRRFSIGAYLFSGLFAQNYWINDPWQYRLPPVYWPYQWVRYYDDALLVDTRSGYVVDTIPGIFW